jgi:hypothetical protein
MRRKKKSQKKREYKKADKGKACAMLWDKHAALAV